MKRGFWSAGMGRLGMAAALAVAGCTKTGTAGPTKQSSAIVVVTPATQPTGMSTQPVAPMTLPALPSTKPVRVGTNGVSGTLDLAEHSTSPATQPTGTYSGSTTITVDTLTLADAAEPAKPQMAAKSASGFDPATSPQTARVKGWYQWRGPEQNGISREKSLPETWNPETGENVAWVAPVGSMSSPVIWNGKIYTWSRANEVPAGAADYPTLAPGPKTQESLVAVDVKTGKVLWTHVNNMTQTEVPFHRLGWSSPCVDPSTGNVYALGSQCWLLCLDGETGAVKWQRQMTEEFGSISTFGGRTQSPTVDEDQVFITGVSFGFGDNARGQHRIFAFNKHTGELNWTNATGGTPVDAPQNTPVVAVIKGQRLVIFAAGDGGIHAFQARTGKKVWTAKVSKRGLNTSIVLDGEKLYCSHGLDNFDTNALGRLFCLDIGNLENGSPKELWKVTGIEAAFPTPVVAEKSVYFVDDRAKLYQVNKETGKIDWKQAVGKVGKASPVYGDGKLYVADGDGRFTIIKPGATSAKILNRQDFNEKLGREYVIYGSPAICDGRVYLQTATKLYAIGSKEAKGDYGEIPPMPAEKDAEQKVAAVQVVPADVLLRPGQKVKFTVRTFDANGRFLGEAKPEDVKFATVQLTIPLPPPRANIPRPDAVAPGAAVVPATAPATAPAGPTLAGNLVGTPEADGTFVGQKGPHQAGAIEATVTGVKAQARVRVLPPLPWKFDFEQSPLGKPPLTWLGAGAKFAVVQDPDDAKNKVVQKLFDIDLYYRARTNFGAVDMSEYTVQADVKVNEKVINEKHILPDGGIMDQRYVLILNGQRQTLQIHIWPSALPDDRNPNGSKHATIDYPWEAHKWYRLKLQVTQEKDKAIARGKCWVVGTEEPKDWTLTLEDDIPNRSGNPGLFAVSGVGEQKSEVYYDNILVTDNKAPAAPAAAMNK